MYFFAKTHGVFGLIGIGAHLSDERTTNMEKKSCEFRGKMYPNGSVTCVGDQCIQCVDGRWGPNEFEAELRKMMFD